MTKTKTLQEAKGIFRTDKVFEVNTAYLVNDFGKYRPNVTFVVPKDFIGDPLAFRSDMPAREMARGMNIDLDGDVAVLFGDFWRSPKGGACFRPKPIANAQHVLMSVGWGGAFNRTRGVRSDVAGAVYYRCAASNGGGAGNDYLIVPVGFYRALHDAEIDGDAATTAPNFVERAKAIREMFERFDHEQAEKAAAHAKAKAEAEAVSQAAKEAGLGARMEAVNAKRVAFGHAPYKLSDSYFGGDYWCGAKLYSEENVKAVERQVVQLEAVQAEKERQRLARETFQPKFEVFKTRAENLGLTIGCYDQGVQIGNDWHNYPYTDEGVISFAEAIAKKEQEAGDARRKAAEALAYAQKCAEAEADSGNILRDFGGVLHVSQQTGQAAFYVVQPNGGLRNFTAEQWSRSHQRGAHSQHWEIVFPEELALSWTKSTNAAPHEFVVHKLPKGGTCTQAQLETVVTLEQEIEREWQGRRGAASGIQSPPVGDGWGLLP